MSGPGTAAAAAAPLLVALAAHAAYNGSSSDAGHNAAGLPALCSDVCGDRGWDWEGRDGDSDDAGAVYCCETGDLAAAVPDAPSAPTEDGDCAAGGAGGDDGDASNADAGSCVVDLDAVERR